MSPVIIQGDFFKTDLSGLAPIHLVIADPPYGGIVNVSWDRLTERESADQYWQMMRTLTGVCCPGATAYVFGGIGRRCNRPFFRALSEIEAAGNWKLHNLITWGKKRAYGKPDNYLFTREEIAMFVLGDRPRVFNVPYLEEKRGYPGYNKKYPAKSEYKRRTNVWTDVTEILRGKKHPCQKPDRLYQIMVETSSNPGDTVLDPFAGSGTLARVCPDRNRILIDLERIEPCDSMRWTRT